MSASSTPLGHGFDIIYLVQDANDYGGTFFAVANAISGWNGCTQSTQYSPICNIAIVLPMNIDLGTDPGSQVWFQFAIYFEQVCNPSCKNVVNWYIYENSNPSGSCGSSITYTGINIDMTSSYSGAGLPYTPGDSYEWHFYETATANQMVFLVEDRTAHHTWWYAFSGLPSTNLVYQTNCFSPAVGIETYVQPGLTALSNMPFFQFDYGLLLCDSVCGTNSHVADAGCDFCTGLSFPSSTSDAANLGIYQSFLEDFNDPVWYWTIFQDTTQVADAITLNPDSSSTPISSANDFLITYTQNGCTNCYNVYYDSDMLQTGNPIDPGALSIAADPNTAVTIYQYSSASNSGEYWCFSLSGGSCQQVSFNSGTSNSGGTVAVYDYYELWSESPYINAVGGGSPPTTTLDYTTAPTTAGQTDSPLSASTSLSTTATNILVVAKSSVTIPTCDPQGLISVLPIVTYCGTNSGAFPSERWDTGICNSITFHLCQDKFAAPSANGIGGIKYYYQYLDGYSFSVSDSSTGYTAPPAVSGTQFGSPISMKLSSTLSYNWFDAGTVWNVAPSTLAGSTSSERWEVSGSGSSGIIGGSITTNVEYFDQFHVTFATSPKNSGLITPASGWFDAATVVPISVTANSGFTFSSWSSGTPSITISGPNSPSTTATINGAGTVTAHFTGSAALSAKLSSSSGSAAPGHSVKTTLTISGSPQTVKLSLGLLPKGVTVTFAKNPITDSKIGVTDVVTISASSSAKAGTYSIAITATGADGQKSTIVYTFTVT